MSLLDIFFLSYSETNADQNWRSLAERFPRAQRVHGIKGVKNAHQVVAQKSASEFFFIVDGDNQISENFHFEFNGKPKADTLYVWRAQNAVNGLVYGFGAIKLYNRQLLQPCQRQLVDVATSIAPKYHIIHEVASTTHFNASPLEAWRGAFRECAKLQMNCFKNPLDRQSLERLQVWLNTGRESLNGQWCLLGAQQGAQFAKSAWKTPEQMTLINDFQWLDNIFISGMTDSQHEVLPSVTL